MYLCVNKKSKPYEDSLLHLSSLYRSADSFSINCTNSDCYHCRFLDWWGTLLGVLSGKNMVAIDMHIFVDPGHCSGAREFARQDLLYICPQSSRRLRYFPDIRILGEKLQMDDEKEYKKNPFCW